MLARTILLRRNMAEFWGNPVNADITCVDETVSRSIYEVAAQENTE
jgi:hypothetical protein